MDEITHAKISFHLNNNSYDEPSFNSEQSYEVQHIQNRKKHTWNCWNFSPSAASCKRRFFSVASNCETCSAYNCIWVCSWADFSWCCWSFRSASWSSSIFCFNYKFMFWSARAHKKKKVIKENICAKLQ